MADMPSNQTKPLKPMTTAINSFKLTVWSQLK